MSNSNRKTKLFFVKILAIAGFCTSCSCESSFQRQVQSDGSEHSSDTLQITASHIERDENALKNWTRYELGQESIALPQGWSVKKYHDALVFTSPTDSVSEMRVFFERFARPDSISDTDPRARFLASSILEGYSVQDSGLLRKLEFERGYLYFRDSIRLSRSRQTLHAQLILLVEDSLIRKYEIVLADDVVKAYQGDFFADVLGNLRINGTLVMSDSNPIKKIISFE